MTFEEFINTRETRSPNAFESYQAESNTIQLFVYRDPRLNEYYAIEDAGEKWNEARYLLLLPCAGGDSAHSSDDRSKLERLLFEFLQAT